MSTRWRSLVSLVCAGALVFGLVPGAVAGAASEAGSVAADSTALKARAAKSGAPKSAERAAAPDAVEYVPGEVIVRFEADASASAVRSANSRAGGESSKRLGRLIPGLRKVELEPGVSVEAAVADYEKQPGVLYAEPNYLVRAAVTPNDTKYGDLWGFNNTGQLGGTIDADMDIPEAWDLTTGSSNVVVAVIDTGIDYNHPDLSSNVWTNAAESAGSPGVDDDGNGYIDDIHGWNAITDSGDPMDDNGHGTHVSGTIAGRGNNGTGVAGVNWNAKVMGLKFLNAAGSGDIADAIQCFEYVGTNANVVVVNNSWGGGGFSQAASDAMAALSDKLLVCAAGNSGVNTDVTPFYPAAYDLENVLVVGASNRKDGVPEFSNFGATSVDVFAPGVAIWSTIPGEPGFGQDGVYLSDNMSNWNNWDLYYVNGYASNPWALSSTAWSAPFAAANTNYIDDQWNLFRTKTGYNLGGASGVWVNAKMRYDLEYDYDFAGVWAHSDQQTTWTPLADYTGSTYGEFEDVWVNASPFVGHTGVKFFFDIFSDESNSSGAGYEGVFVDDVRILAGQFDGPTKYYDFWNGTSMASPNVAGLAGLMHAVNPSLTATETKAAIMNTVDTKPAMTGASVTGGRVNAKAAIDQVNPGTIKGWVKWNGVPLSGASVRIDSLPTMLTRSDGTYSLGGISPGPHTVTVWKTGYVTKTITGATTTLGGTTPVNVSLVARPVITRSPTSSSLTYKRRSGVAKFKLAGTFKTVNGRPMTGRRVYLQSSKSGTGGWSNTYALTTDGYGKATKSFRVKTARTRYYRWFIPASGLNTAAYGAKQKVRVR